MATIVRATCGRCYYDVELRPSDVAVRLAGEWAASFAFRCPRCHRSTACPLDLPRCGALVTAGADLALDLDTGDQPA